MVGENPAHLVYWSRVEHGEMGRIGGLSEGERQDSPLDSGCYVEIG